MVLADSPDNSAPSADDSLATYAELVKETELRRRVNVLYPNPQSIFDGLQVGYVSVRHGNLTFRRRDIVAGTNSLAEFTRVYDSRTHTGRDFGPGWRLSLEEGLTLTKGRLVYTDGSGARHYFSRAASGGTGLDREPLAGKQIHLGAAEGDPVPSSSWSSGIFRAFPVTPQHSATTIEIAGPLAILRKGQEIRVFERSQAAAASGANYRLSHIAFGSGKRIALSYRSGLIHTVSDADGPLFEVIRDGSGRIVSVQDRWGRQVHYSYDANGRLAEARDIAGNAWSYEYTPLGQLTRAIGPNGRDILRIQYDGAGRVQESLSGRKYSFAYASDQTIVVEGTEHSHVFEHNAAGITDRFDSTNGVWWQLKLDNDNRVVAAFSSNGTYQYDYNPHGRITRAIEQLPDGFGVRNFQYDDQRRITGVYSEAGAFTAVDYTGGSTRISAPTGEFAFDVMPSGRIGEIRTDQLSVSADYDAADNLAAFRSGPNAVEFGRDELGRVSKVRYANGEVNQYRYDDLGNRAHVSFGSRGAVEYMHDPSGNIVTVNVTQRNGEENRQVIQIGDMNRVEEITYEGAGKLDIGYDHMGRAVSFDMGREVIAVEYEGPDRIGKIVTEKSGAAWSPGDDDEAEVDTHEVMDARLEVMHKDSSGAPQQDYGIVRFDEFTFQLVESDPMEMAVSGLREARAILAVTEPLFSGNNRIGAMMDFEKPSNPVFQPLEYRSTNCCILIPEHLRAVVPDGRPFSDGTPSFCSPVTVVFTTGLPDYKLPPETSMPTINNDHDFLEGFDWGRADIWPDPQLSCRPVPNSRKARLEGDIEMLQNELKIAQKVQATEKDGVKCAASNRTDDNKRRTTLHEQEHARVLIGAINDFKLNRENGLGKIHSSMGGCELAAERFESEFRDKYEAVNAAEGAHERAIFQGVTKHVAECNKQTKVSEERDSGTPITDC